MWKAKVGLGAAVVFSEIGGRNSDRVVVGEWLYLQLINDFEELNLADFCSGYLFDLTGGHTGRSEKDYDYLSLLQIGLDLYPSLLAPEVC